MVNSNNESWCQGLDGLAQRTAEYYKAGARFAKWRGVVDITKGPSMIALRDTAYGLARYAAIAQVLSSDYQSVGALRTSCCSAACDLCHCIICWYRGSGKSSVPAAAIALLVQLQWLVCH